MAPSLGIAFALLALLAGFAVGWFVCGGRSATRLAQAEARAIGNEALVAGLREQLAEARSHAAEHTERSAGDRAVLEALTPVREALHAMQLQVATMERDRAEQFGLVSAQLRQQREAEEQLRTSADALARALGNESSRGVWGETQLRRVVEAAGMTRHIDFSEQPTVQVSGRALRPDMLVHLPGGASIAVDAKVPLTSYLEATSLTASADPAAQSRRAELLRQHAAALRGHVDELGKREYWRGETSTPEFVVCFVPSEALLASALDTDPALLDHAFGRGVALASPVSLWSILKSVAFTWGQHTVSEDARELIALGTTLYSRLSTLAGHADALRRSIERTVTSYNQFAGALEARVLVTARKFPEATGATTVADLPVPSAITETPRLFGSAEMQPAAPTTPVDVPKDTHPGATELDELRSRLEERS